MKEVFYEAESNMKPIKSWVGEIEQDPLDQAYNLAKLPFVVRHIALMPDCHFGYGMPIGGVMATEKVVVPNAVGVDIGCGVQAVETGFLGFALDKDTLKAIMGDIRKVIPVGFNHQQEAQDVALMPREGFCIIVHDQYQNARKQLGTLGGGNHFIEIQYDELGFLWIMVHSGSRNLGFKVAKYYNDKAKDLNKQWFTEVPEKWDLAFLPMDESMGESYMTEMQYCVDFAKANRDLMMVRIMDVFRERLDCKFNLPIDIAHNYAAMENHFGKNVLVHRKGATRAREGDIGIIPGSQGTASYIVRGLGEKDSFMSCSHGAGRTMGRKVAQRTLDLEAEIKKLDDQGIIHSIRNKDDLDEAPSAYKDIEEVMANQTDLVEIVTKLRPLGVIKA